MRELIFGDVLDCGANVIEGKRISYDRQVVLCHWGGDYVVWYIDGRGRTSDGEYSRGINIAGNNFAARVADSR